MRPGALVRALVAAVLLASCSGSGDSAPPVDADVSPQLGDFVPAIASMSLVAAEPGQRVLLAADRWDTSRGFQIESAEEALRGSFYIDTFEVTNREYAAFLGRSSANSGAGTGAVRTLWGGDEPPESIADHPVTGVTALAAEAFAADLGKRLPTASEWNRAALRPGDRFPWTGPFHRNRCNSIELGLGSTTIVGTFESGKSSWGVYDVYGNVWEWTSTVATLRDGSRRGRIVVGGAFDTWISPRNRGFPWQIEEPLNWSSSLGFRCVRDVDDALVRRVIEVARGGPAALRREAIAHLREYQSELAVPALESVATTDPDPSIRTLSARSLIGPTAPPAVSTAALLVLLEKEADPRLRAEAARELAVRGEEVGIAALRDSFARGESLEVRQFAFGSLLSLGLLGDAPAVAAALRAEPDDDVRAAMAGALVDRMSASSPAFAPILASIAEDPSAAVRKRLVEGLADRGLPDEVADLAARIAASDAAPHVREEAIRALDAAPDHLLATVAARLPLPEGDEVAEVRAALAESAALLGPRLAGSPALTVLVSSLRSDPSVAVRLAIARSLWQIRFAGFDADGAALRALTEAAISDAAKDVRLEATRALAATGLPETAIPLVERLEEGGEEDSSVAAALVVAAARLGEERALAVVTARLSDDDPAVSRVALQALVYCGTKGLEAAEARATEILAESPDDPEALVLRARIAARRGDVEQTLSYLRRLENALARDESFGGLDGLGLADDPLLAPILFETGERR